MKKSEQKAWEIRIGNKLWLVIAERKPTIKESKVRGLKCNAIIIDEIVSKEYRKEYEKDKK